MYSARNITKKTTFWGFISSYLIGPIKFPISTMDAKIWIGKKIFASDVFMDFNEQKQPAARNLNYVALFICFAHATYLFFSGRMTLSFLGVTTCYLPAVLCTITELFFSRKKMLAGMIFTFITVPIAITLKGLYEPMAGLMLFPLTYGIVCFFLLPKPGYIYFVFILSVCCFITIDVAYHYKYNVHFKEDISLILFNSLLFSLLLYAVLGYLRNLLTAYQNQRVIKEKELSQQNTLLSFQQEKIAQQNDLLQNRNRLLIESWHFQQKITSILSHDTRTSMIFIRHILSIYKKEKNADPDAMGFVSEVDIEIQKMNAVFNEVLQWLKQPTVNSSVVKGLVNLADIAEEINYTFTGHAKTKGIQLVNKIAPSQQVYANADYLKVILRNLVSNAIKFTKKDGHVILYGFVKDEMYNLFIEDNGIGISADNLKKIQEGIEFTTTSPYKEEGTGLGMAFCRDFVEKSDAKMSIESTVDQGTVITIQLPLVKTNALN